jgi:hypothetical protein
MENDEFVEEKLHSLGLYFSSNIIKDFWRNEILDMQLVRKTEMHK